jgi:RNA polymerase sigma-54 factor
MKQRLQLRIGQQLSMTPQLRQAIKLLQLSSVDLHLEIQQALYSNPMLELANEIEQAEQSTEKEEHELPGDEENSGEDDWPQEIPGELPIDSSWEDTYPGIQSASPGSSPSTSASSSNVTSSNSQGLDFEEFHNVTESLRDHLLWQLNLAPLSDRDHLIGSTIIDNINDAGFLETTIEELWRANYRDDESEDGIELDEVNAVLHQIQQFDPPGIAAIDLRECLLIQLNQLSPDTPGREDAIVLVDQHLQLIAEKNYPMLVRSSGINEVSVKAVISLIKTLSPHPGESITSRQIDYIVPDVTVRNYQSRWVVSLNSDLVSNLCINQEYARLVQRANNSKDNTFLRNNLQEARWFLRSLESRNETLMRVSRSIVEKQQGFLEHGPEAMKPMVLADIAELLGLHESTISRITTQKYIATPRGIFELKYFFSSHISTTTGGECSSTAIRAMLKRMIAAEPTTKPLSDNKLASMLQDEGIQVARRTVAKYRESLRIPSSSERRRFG